MGSGGHLGFMQITRVAQSCQFGNKAEFVLGPHYIMNHQNKFIGKRMTGVLNIYECHTTIKPL